MKPEFTPSGIEIQTYQEIYDELADSYRGIYGNDINLDSDSPDGQRVGIEAQARLDLQTFGLTMYQQSDPDFAFGQSLNRIIKLSGITLRPATRSQVDVTITTDRALTLPINYTIEDTIGQLWKTLSTVPLISGANTVTLFSDFGAIEASIGTVTKQVTFVIGVLSVTNPAIATIGKNEETEPELRSRRNKSLENPSTSTVGAMFSALGNLTGVTDLAVYENDQDTTDVTLSMAPHSIWAIVEGGAVDDIIGTMAKNKTGGTTIKGAVTGTYTETLQKPNGSTFTIIHEMAFDRPTDVPIYVQLTATRKDPAVPVDIDAIKEQLNGRVFTISENVIASDLYQNVYAAGTNFIATALEISLDDITYVDSSLTSAADGKFNIPLLNIAVTEVV